MALKVLKASGGKGADFDPKAEAVRLHASGSSPAAIAAALRLSPKTVKKYIAAAGRTSGALRPRVSGEEIQRWCARYESGESPLSIARSTGRKERTVRSALAGAGVCVPETHKAKARRLRSEALRLYSEEGLSTEEIGSRLGFSGSAIYQWVESAGVVRTKQAAHKLRAKPTPNAARDSEIVRLYVDQSLSSGEIGNRLGLRPSTVCKIIVRRGHQLRPKGAKLPQQENPTDA